MPESEDAPAVWEYILYIPNDPRAVRICRQTLRAVLAAHGFPQLTAAAELLATELVTNAVRHTRGPAAMKLRAEHRTLRIGVWDNDPAPPRPSRDTPWDAETGRGLGLVRACSERWGWVQQPDHKNIVGVGKYIWCDLVSAVA